MMEMILRTSGLATLRDQATLFVLMAPDEVSGLSAIALALEKASLPTIQSADLPVVGLCLPMLHWFTLAFFVAMYFELASQQPHDVSQSLAI